MNTYRVSGCPRYLHVDSYQLDGNPKKLGIRSIRKKVLQIYLGSLGPSLLEGINKRFSSQDLFRATVDPSHTISDRYRAKQVRTTDDRILIGMTIYESADGLTLLTADAKMLRINADAIAEMKPSVTSLMPEGLLDGLSDDQAADLLAYMRSF